MKRHTYTLPGVLALTVLGLIATGCQQSAPPQQTSSAPAPSQSTETTTQTKSVEVQPSPNPADPDASGQKMVKKETTTVKKQQ
jgi:hypothetical protein